MFICDAMHMSDITVDPRIGIDFYGINVGSEFHSETNNTGDTRTGDDLSVGGALVDPSLNESSS